MLWTIHLEGGPRRVNHAAVAIGNFIYSFGGYCSSDEYRLATAIDVHILNTNNMRWSLLPPQRNEKGRLTTYPKVPFQRYGHTVVAYKHWVFLWGGRNDDTACNILYCFDTKALKWIRPKVQGNVPGARDGHSACIVNHYMYIFGGFEEEIEQFSRDVHCLDLRTLTWTYIETTGPPPSYRDFHSSTAINDKMYVFGGRGDQHSPYHSQEEIYCAQIMYLDLNTKRWHMPTATGRVPLGRRSHSSFVYNKMIYIFGGFNGLMDEHFNDLYCYDTARNHWSLVNPGGSPPRPRRRQSCLVIENRMFLFGGTSYISSPSMDEDGSPALIDYDDIHVLDFLPSLKTLSIVKVLEHNIDQQWLPHDVRIEIRAMTTPNVISRPLTHTG